MEVTRYDKLLFDKLTYEKPENQSNVYFGPMYYNQIGRASCRERV